VGEWADNQFVKGRWFFPNGTFYEGTFNNNKPSGDGVWHFYNGNQLAGNYKQTVIPNEDPDDKKVNIKLDYQSNVGISEAAWQINAHEIF
jgi:radial spoke head protein 1